MAHKGHEVRKIAKSKTVRAGIFPRSDFLFFRLCFDIILADGLYKRDEVDDVGNPDNCQNYAGNPYALSRHHEKAEAHKERYGGDY